LVVLLTLATFVQAQNIETWTGSLSFTLKLTSEKEDTGGNRTLVTSRETFQGAMNFYWDRTSKTPTPGPDGCILELLGSDGTKICFNEFMGTSTLTKKSGKGSSVFVGTGNIATTVQGHGDTGPVYINGKGSQVLDSSGNPISGSFGGAIVTQINHF